MSTRSHSNGKTDLVIHRVLIGSHQVSEYLNSACERAGVSLPLARALQFLAEAEGPVTPTELSRELGRSPAATSELVKRLVNSEQITADIDPNDRRSFQLALTSRGHSKWQGVRAELEAAEAFITRRYGKRQLTDLAGAIDDLAAALNGAASG
ncbi:MAG: MarR family transcriptional regulator [Chloroflexi bacterium]|nr:MarR family transcriptional regulator [Chloroflexota bacterium]